MPKKLNRKIYCFILQKDPSQLASEIATRMNALPWVLGQNEEGNPVPVPNSRYLHYDDEKLLCGWFEVKTDKSVEIRLSFSRHGGWPLHEVDGKLIPLNLKGQLAESTHMIWFPDGFLLAEYNHFGPRPTSLINYFHEKLQIDTISLSAVLSASVLQEIERFSRINVARFSMTVKDLKKTKTEKGKVPLLDALEVNSTIDEEVVLDFSFKVERGNNNTGLRDKFVGFCRWLFTKPERLETIRVLTARGKKGEERVCMINLLEDKIYFERRIVPISENSRNVSSKEMYKMIREVYEELKSRLP